MFTWTLKGELTISRRTPNKHYIINNKHNFITITTTINNDYYNNN